MQAGVSTACMYPELTEEVLYNYAVNGISHVEIFFNSDSELKKSFIANLLDFNINVIYCVNLVFNFKILKSNIGFYFMASMCFLQIIFLFIFLCKRLKPIRYFMFRFQNQKGVVSTPPKSDKKNFSLKDGEGVNNHNNNKKINNIRNNFANRKKYNLQKKRDNVYFMEDEANNKNNIDSKRKINLMDTERNVENVLEAKNKDLLNINHLITNSKKLNFIIYK